MRNAFESRIEYTKEGKPVKKELAVGAIVPWSIVLIIALLVGKVVVNVPSVAWQFWKW